MTNNKVDHFVKRLRALNSELISETDLQHILHHIPGH
jgi:hypothetical protein